MSILFFCFVASEFVSTCLDIFLLGKGSIEFHDAELLQEKKFTCDVFSFFFPPQLMPFPWFPLWCCLCPTLGHSTGRGDTPKYINSLTRSETH